MSYVDSITMTQINSYWGGNTKLLFTPDSFTSVYSVMLFNTDVPIAKPTLPYEYLFEGKLDLREY
jgi:hypothetical protein